MRRHFEEVEEELKSQLLYMGSLAEEMIHLAAKALMERTDKPLEGIYRNEKQVNDLHIEIDARSLKLIALHQPAATDLRFIVAAIKINSDLERVADQAVNIAENTEELLAMPQLEQKLLDIPRMAEMANTMLKDSLDAFVQKNVDMAWSVVRRDDEEDNLKSQAFHELMQIMLADSSTIRRAVRLILISRSLERIADHATNIAEDVIFMVLGDDIRHHRAEGPPPPAS